MKSLKHFFRHLLCCILWSGCLLFGCKRDIPELPTNELRNVTFRLAGFEAETMPLRGSRAATMLALDVGGSGPYTLRNLEPSLEPQYLYYWSFNNEDLEPDIAVDEVGAGISFEAKSSDFVNGRKLGPFEAGRALKITGASSLVITLPIAAIEYLTNLSFDIKSSDTGPKDFSFLYSVDGGTTYEEWTASNQFEKTKDTQWNEYTFDIGDFPEFVEGELLKFKLIFLPGNRGDGGVYSESSGVVHLDNIRLSGVYNAEAEPSDPTMPSTLHYYIFSSEDGSVVQHQELVMSALGSDGALDVKLADGSYDVLFVAYRTDKEILLPAEPANANEFYFGQHFDDYRAVTYSALLDDVVIGGDHAVVDATLSRCYSLVEFDFTDAAADLQRVKRIDITKAHDNFLYTPFGVPAEVQMSDAHTIEFSGFDQVEDYRIALHQFFGLLAGVGTISYEVTAYGEGGVVLNAVTITHDIRNNIRLRLTGRLLGSSGAVNGFSMALDTKWGETLEREF